MPEIILQISNLSKNYGKLKALNELSLEVHKGMVYGILGPNGSGKTTTLGIVLGVLNASSGSFSWFNNGTDDANRKRIGALLETPNFYPYLSAVQNLRIVAAIKDVTAVNEAITKALKSVNLYDRRGDEFRTYSLGMKQRLALASALLGNPDVLVLDEPTNGLDPQGIAEIRALIRAIAKEGKTIIIASHQLDEIEKVCSHVLILKQGQVLKTAPINELVDRVRQVKLKAENSMELEQALLKFDYLTIVKSDDTFIVVQVPEGFKTSDLNRDLFNNGVCLSALEELNKSLEEQFLEIVG